MKSNSCLLYSCSRRFDWLTDLPLSPSNPEEDRAGKGLLTAPPAGLHCATHTKTRTQRDRMRWERERKVGRQTVWKEKWAACTVLPLPLSYLSEKKYRKRQRFLFSKVFNSSVLFLEMHWREILGCFSQLHFALHCLNQVQKSTRERTRKEKKMLHPSPEAPSWKQETFCSCLLSVQFSMKLCARFFLCSHI